MEEYNFKNDVLRLANEFYTEQGKYIALDGFNGNIIAYHKDPGQAD